MKPSRTYTLGVLGVSAQLLLAVAALVVMAVAPDQLDHLTELLASLGMYAAACAGGGAGAMAARDYGSGGLTSSQGHHVLESATHKPDPNGP